MFPSSIISLYGNIAPIPTYTDDGNTNSLTGTGTTIGTNSNFGDYGTNFARYNISENTWTTLASYTGTGTRQKIGRMGDNIYARSSVTGLYVYKLSTNTWSVLNSTLPAGSSEGGLVCSYDHAYAISGRTLYRFN